MLNNFGGVTLQSITRLMINKTKKQPIMKTIKNMISLISFPLFALLMGFQTFAANSVYSDLAGTGTFCSLMPVTPKEATFEEGPMEFLTMDKSPEKILNIMDFAPVTPKEASFEVVPSYDDQVWIRQLEPKVPAEADFTDNDPDLSSNIFLLAPVNPSEADFSDPV